MAATLVANVDVLEVIAEYACGTIADVCRLRRACSGFRRAADTTVRRLVFDNQPLLRARPSRNGAEIVPAAALRLEREAGGLDTVRIAFTFDTFRRIAHVVVTAFALDGPKDPMREGAECGPRPVVCPLADCPLLPPHSAAESIAAPFGRPAPLLSFAPAHVHAALRGAFVDAFATPALLAANAIERSAANAWANVRQLRLSDPATNWRDADDGRRAAALLRILSPQLTELHFDGCSAEVWGAVATCRVLKKIVQASSSVDAGDSRAICGAILASGAPLEHIEAALSAEDGLELLERIPTIKRASIRSLTKAALPDGVASRLHQFNGLPMPSFDEYVTIESAADWGEGGAETVGEVYVENETPMTFPDLDIAYPNLQMLQMDDFTAVSTDEHIRNLRFPASLCTLKAYNADPTPSTALLRRIQALAGEGHLRQLGTLKLSVRAPMDVTPLVALSGWLTALDLGGRGVGAWCAAGHLEALEATLSQLVMLEELTVEDLPSTRCLLGGRHTRLRKLTALSIDAADAKFAALIKACPRLTSADGCSTNFPAFDCPAGWAKFSKFPVGTIARRISFHPIA